MIWLFLALGCASPRRGLPVADAVAFSDEAAAGEVVFAHHCGECHPNGEGGLAPPINNRPIPGFLIRAQVRSGLGAMPAFPKEELSEAELDAVVSYLLELRRSN